MTTPEFTLVLFELPDNRIVLQRRTQDAPYGAGKLGIFGGWLEENETPLEGLKREIVEETSLDLSLLDIKFLTDLSMPASSDFPQNRHFYLYSTKITDMRFEVYEGDGAEAFSLEEIHQRQDLTGSAEFVFAKLSTS